MSRRPALPSIDEVEKAKDAVIAEADASAKRPSVLTLARRLGLSNTTLRRHFPDIVREISTRRHQQANPDGKPSTTSPIATEAMARLRRENNDLKTQLEIAIASIHRLALDNHELRGALEAATKVTHITTATRRPAHPRRPGGRS
ncbi:MAG TPA: hypothetical protein VFG35_00835 [Actinoplanes sp.]|nr:hypothetical protein [Actinoplanes sp.]